MGRNLHFEMAAKRAVGGPSTNETDSGCILGRIVDAARLALRGELMPFLLIKDLRHDNVVRYTRPIMEFLRWLAIYFQNGSALCSRD